MVVNKEFARLSYYEARDWLDHEAALEQVAGQTGQPVEVIAEVVAEEAEAA